MLQTCSRKISVYLVIGKQSCEIDSSVRYVQVRYVQSCSMKKCL